MNEDRLRAAVSAGVIRSEESHRALLQSIVEVARAIFSAKAASIFLHDRATDELVFEAVAGEGEETLIGRRLPAAQGVAGWVLVTRQPLVIEDLTKDPRFARDTAESTGYVPKGMMSAPLLHEDNALGVLNVLDRPQRSKFSLQEMDLLGLFANQAAIALDLLVHAREAAGILAGIDGDLSVVARVAASLDALEDERREAGLRLLQDLEKVLRND